MKTDAIMGAIIGDVVGSRFELSNYLATDFALLTPINKFTDDTVMTIAIADWLLSGKKEVGRYLRKWGHKYQ